MQEEPKYYLLTNTSVLQWQIQVFPTDKYNVLYWQNIQILNIADLKVTVGLSRLWPGLRVWYMARINIVWHSLPQLKYMFTGYKNVWNTTKIYICCVIYVAIYIMYYETQMFVVHNVIHNTNTQYKKSYLQSDLWPRTINTLNSGRASKLSTHTNTNIMECKQNMKFKTRTNMKLKNMKNASTPDGSYPPMSRVMGEIWAYLGAFWYGR